MSTVHTVDDFAEEVVVVITKVGPPIKKIVLLSPFGGLEWN